MYLLLHRRLVQYSPVWLYFLQESWYKSDGHLRQYGASVCMGVCVLKVHSALIIIPVLYRFDKPPSLVWDPLSYRLLNNPIHSNTNSCNSCQR